MGAIQGEHGTTVTAVAAGTSAEPSSEESPGSANSAAGARAIMGMGGCLVHDQGVIWPWRQCSRVIKWDLTVSEAGVRPAATRRQHTLASASSLVAADASTDDPQCAGDSSSDGETSGDAEPHVAEEASSRADRVRLSIRDRYDDEMMYRIGRATPLG